MADWELIKKEFEETGISLADLATKYNVKSSTMKSRKQRGDWVRKKDASKGKKNASKQVKKDASIKGTHDHPTQPEVVHLETSELTDKQRKFIEEYLIDCNATQAAVRAGYSIKTAMEQGYQLLQKTTVKHAIQEAMKNREQRTEITADRVLQELWAIATSDTNEIVELRRSCCRFCWGENFKYQFTENEMERRREQCEAAKESALKEGRPLLEFDEAGGIGFDATKDPSLNCPECFGEGVNTPHFNDTRKLSAGAKALYAGVKIGKGGIEVKMHSKDKALELIGKHLGMFIEKIEVKDTTDRAQSMKKARERARNGQAKQ